MRGDVLDAVRSLPRSEDSSYYLARRGGVAQVAAKESGLFPKCLRTKGGALAIAGKARSGKLMFVGAV